MKIEELFEKGVMLNDGPMAGERLSVESVDKDGVYVRDKNKELTHLNYGEFEIWHPARTLFEDPAIKPTWGNLKKAAEAAGVSDDAVFAVHGLGLLPSLEYANFDLVVGKKGEQTIVVY